jgi:hypothetical protein
MCKIKYYLTFTVLPHQIRPLIFSRITIFSIFQKLPHSQIYVILLFLSAVYIGILGFISFTVIVKIYFLLKCLAFVIYVNLLFTRSMFILLIRELNVLLTGLIIAGYFECPWLFLLVNIT